MDRGVERIIILYYDYEMTRVCIVGRCRKIYIYIYRRIARNSRVRFTFAFIY